MSGPATRSGRLQTAQNEPQSRAKWTTSLTKSLVDLMVDHVHLRSNHKVSTGNKWKYICDEFHNRTGLKWDKEQLKYRCAVLKKLYATVKSLLDQGDFCWDENTGAITAKDEVWDKYIKDHPDADTLRSSGCPIYKQLCIIFSESSQRAENINASSEKGGSANFTEDCSTESEEVADVANEQDKSQCVDNNPTTTTTATTTTTTTTTATTVNRKRGRKSLEDTLADAILEMAAASKMRAEAIQQCNQRFSISKCVNALDELQDGIDEKVYFAALDLFNDPIAREIFLSLKVDKRLVWLKGKCKFSCDA